MCEIVILGVKYHTMYWMDLARIGLGLGIYQTALDGSRSYEYNIFHLEQALMFVHTKL